jgi:hypothetical protein
MFRPLLGDFETRLTMRAQLISRSLSTGSIPGKPREEIQATATEIAADT